jgi:hypothetical protein
MVPISFAVPAMPQASDTAYPRMTADQQLDAILSRLGSIETRLNSLEKTR